MSIYLGGWRRGFWGGGDVGEREREKKKRGGGGVYIEGK